MSASELKKAKEENEKLKQENEFFRSLLQDVAQHLIDVDGDDWYCLVCGERAPLEVPAEKFPHKHTCALHKSE